MQETGQQSSLRVTRSDIGLGRVRIFLAAVASIWAGGMWILIRAIVS